MQDPLPSNIDGQKVVSHEVQHSVNWGYVAVAVAAIYVGSRLLSDVDRGKDEGGGGHTGR